MRRILLALVLLGAPSLAAQESPLQGYDDYVRKAIHDWEVPGLAMAIVKDDAVVLAKGYGVRRLGETTPVDARTLFAIGSASKAFTAVSLAMLVDEGKIKWDDPVTKHLAGFQLFDPYVTREITVRDLLCHRSGLGACNLLWYGGAHGRDEILRRVRHLKPESSFRSKFSYQNIMFLAAGQVIPAATGKSWDDFVRERIFAPLGMSSSVTSVSALAGLENVATPHGRIDGKVRTVSWRNIDNCGPAGSILSTAADMAQWLRVQLGGGAVGERRLFSAAAAREMHTAQTVIRPDHVWTPLNWPESHFQAYGLAWFLHDYKGRKVVEHGGNVDGMRALVAMMPEEKLGVVILSNMNNSRLPHPLVYRVFDAYLGAAPRDWSAERLAALRRSEEQARAKERQAEEAREKGTSPSLPLEKYAGTYEADLLGRVRVVHEGVRLVLVFGPAASGDFEHWEKDTFQVTWRDGIWGKFLVTFEPDGSAMKFPEAVFKRVP